MLGMFGFFRMLRRPFRRSTLAGLTLMFGAGAAGAFDTANYQPADLDVLARRKPALGLGADISPVQNVRLEVTLAAQPAECPTKYLKWAMRKSGIAKEAVQGTPITQCIKVKSAKGRQYTVFIQDALTGSLAREVKPGAKVTLYGSLVYFAPRGPGIVVNDFSTQPTTTPQPHSGVDLGAAKKK